MIDRFITFFGSLRLTIVCLSLAAVLVFAGTLAQVRLGLYVVQSEFFRSFFIYWTPSGTHWKIPVFPGGWSIGLVLLVNLLAAHIQRFHFSRRKVGLLLVHAGLILLLAGFFLSEVFQIESQMRLEPGQPKNYAEDARGNELVVLDVTSPDHDDVVAIPQSLLENGGEIRPPGLPFALRVKRFIGNALPAGPMSGGGEKLRAANGIGQRLLFTAAPPAGRMDDENKPAALIEVASGAQVIGDWTVSTWLTKRPWCTALNEQFGALLGGPVDARQSFTWAGRLYEIALRPVRYYKPYTITLLEFKHDVYAGTDIPSNFSSRIHLSDPARGEDRDVLIRMNSPLRYGGQSYYQASFEPGNKVSILQVVHNPAAVIPYVACSLMGIGLLAQFLTHLIGFARKRARQAAPVSKPARTQVRFVEPVLEMKKERRMKKWISSIICGFFALWFLSGAQSPRPVDGFDLAGFGRLPVLLNGRIQPFDSVARNTLLSMSGRSTVHLADGHSLSATEWLLETMTKPNLADQRKVFRIQHPDLQGLLGSEKQGLQYYSFNNLTNSLDSVVAQALKLQDAESREGDEAEKARTPFQKDLMHLYESLALYSRLRQNLAPAGVFAYVRAVPPLAGEPRNSWKSVEASLTNSPEIHPAVKFYAAMATACRDDDPAGFNRAVAGYRVWLQENQLGPELEKGSREFFFNQIEPFYKSMVIYVAAVLLGCVFWINLSEPVRRTGFALLALAFVIHTVGLGLRMYLEGRPPVTNLYSSAIFIGWGSVALGLILERVFKGGIGLVSSGLIGFVTLIIAHHLALSGDTMEMLRAVLDTNLWLSTHVVVITIGYASMFVAGLLAAIYIVRGFFTRALSPETARSLARMVYGIVCFATLTSFIGTILGGIWADQSWGRFWGWDPKENGALLIVLWNAIILHARWGGLIKERDLMAMAVFGNIVTSFSWFGVNMLGVGLHSYGFMDKAFFWLMLFDASQAFLIVLALAPSRFWASFTQRPAAIKA